MRTSTRGDLHLNLKVDKLTHKVAVDFESPGHDRTVVNMPTDEVLGALNQLAEANEREELWSWATWEPKTAAHEDVAFTRIGRKEYRVGPATVSAPRKKRDKKKAKAEKKARKRQRR